MATNPFTVYTGSDTTTLTTALLAPSSGIVIDSTSIVLNASGQDAVNFYDGTLAPLAIDAGLLLTSGTTPGTANTMPWFGTDNSGTSGFYNGDANIDAVVNTVFQTQSYDATTLSFDFTVTDPSATSVSFDLVFGSDEFPEWVDQFVDCAIVMVNGVNYALFNHDPMHPLSVVSSNLAAGYFQDNAGNVLPIEYDGVSHVLKIVAPIIAGQTNHIEIGIADTGDHIYDSGIFIANLSAGNIPGSGVVSPTTICTDSSDSVTGSVKDEYFDLKGGDDVAYAGAGDDIVVAGSGNDSVYGGSGADQMKGDAGDDFLDGGTSLDVYGNVQKDTAVYAGASNSYLLAYDGVSFTVTDTDSADGAEGTDTLTNVELFKFKDGLFEYSGGNLVSVTDPGTTPPTNSPGTVVVSGIGADGNTLTATLSDPDGISVSPSYQWETSSDGGLNWSAISGATGNTYLVTTADVGTDIRVSASYTDGKGADVTGLASTAKTVVPPSDGDITILLLELATPDGASVMNPLTTLVYDAIQFGVSPNLAADYVKTVLGIDPTVDLLHYDAWEILQASPNDTFALAVEEIAAQVAVLTSASGDQNGLALTQAIIMAALEQPVKHLDLSNVLDVEGILGLPHTDPVVQEILDRNQNISQSHSVADIEKEWADLQSNLDVPLSDTIGDLSVHVNLGPAGTASDTLPNWEPGINFTAAQLLAGFTDPDGDILSVSDLMSDQGVFSSTDGGQTFAFTPNATYSGPVEFTYLVTDGNGGNAPASQMFIILPPPNHAPVGLPLVSGTPTQGEVLTAVTNGISDADGLGTFSYQWLREGAAITLATADTYTLAEADVGTQLSVRVSYTDGYGKSEAVTSEATTAVANVNDLPAGEVFIAGTAMQGETLTASDTLVDADGIPTSGIGSISYQWQAAGIDISGATSTSYTLTQADVDKAITVTASYTDGHGTAEAVTSTATTAVANVNDLPTGAVNIAGAPTKGETLTASNTLADADGIGIGSISYQWQAAGIDISGAAGTSYTLTQAEVGKAITVTASYTDLMGTHESMLSAPTAPVVPGLTLPGTAAADVLSGGIGDDNLSGLAGNDTLNGGAGNDLLEGGLGKDTLNGDAGIDTASYAASTKGVSIDLKANTASGGDALGDHLYSIENLLGSAFNDTLVGNDGVNDLSGGDGNDVLRGLGGSDSLSGGSGADRFDFDAISDSGLGAADLIFGFEHGSDKIDLSTIDANASVKKDQAFTFINGETFTGAGQLRFEYSSGTDTTIIQGNTDANPAAEFEIQLIGHISLTAADFIL